MEKKPAAYLSQPRHVWGEIDTEIRMRKAKHICKIKKIEAEMHEFQELEKLTHKVHARKFYKKLRGLTVVYRAGSNSCKNQREDVATERRVY